MAIILINSTFFIIASVCLIGCVGRTITSEAPVNSEKIYEKRPPLLLRNSNNDKSLSDTDISIDERLKVFIDRWIEENNLNEYGDPKDTMYIGGTPLFDETTGKRIDRYRYIIDRHPELLMYKE